MRVSKQKIWYMLICFFLVSCKSRSEYTEIIASAGRLLNSNPQSAYRLLLTVQQPEKLSTADYAAWCLYYTHAQYKLFFEIKSDRLIRISIRYFSQYNDSLQCGTAYYLLGCILQLKQQNQSAMQAYKCADKLLYGTADYNMQGLVEFKIAYMFKQTEAYIQSLKYYKKSLRHFLLSNNKTNQAYAYRELSEMYYQLDYGFDSVVVNSNQALKLAKEVGDSVNYYCILSRQGELFSTSQYTYSKQCLLRAYRFFPTQRLYYAAYLSFVYSKLNQPDSSRYYLQLSLSDSLNTSTRIIIYLSSAYIYKKLGNDNKAFCNLERAYVLRDSLFKKKLYSQLYQIDKQFDFTQKKQENSGLIIENRNKLVVIFLLIILILVFTIFYLVLSNRYRKNKASHLFEKKQLEYNIELKQMGNKIKRELLLSKLRSKIENTLCLNRLKLGLKNPDKYDEFVRHIANQSIISEKEWQYYIDEVNYIFDQKIINLSNQNTQLTSSDIIVITLICLELDVPDCCSLLNMTKNTMYHRRNKIKKRIGLDKDTDLEQWVVVNICN